MRYHQLRHAVIALVFAMSSPAFAVDFDPLKHGLADPEPGIVRHHPDPGLSCTFLRNAVEGPQKVWSCNDGSTRYGGSDIWSHPGDVVSAPEKPAEVDQDFDPSVSVPGHSFMTITTWLNNRYCSGGKGRSCSGRQIQSFSHMLIPGDAASCLVLAEKIAYQQYVTAQVRESRIRISYDCQ
ncbi:hypothetical protein G6L37_34840 [Agrobacterium rubi]|nr:hypothetical protein [Agrobacterium rubi]NTF23746.1 hypothetical protein [Agrobacterium rubi]